MPPVSAMPAAAPAHRSASGRLMATRRQRAFVTPRPPSRSPPPSRRAPRPARCGGRRPAAWQCRRAGLPRTPGRHWRPRRPTDAVWQVIDRLDRDGDPVGSRRHGGIDGIRDAGPGPADRSSRDTPRSSAACRAPFAMATDEGPRAVLSGRAMSPGPALTRRTRCRPSVARRARGQAVACPRAHHVHGCYLTVRVPSMPACRCPGTLQ